MTLTITPDTQEQNRTIKGQAFYHPANINLKDYKVTGFVCEDTGHVKSYKEDASQYFDMIECTRDNVKNKKPVMTARGWRKSEGISTVIILKLK